MFETEQLTIKQAALLTGKDEKTIRRWITVQKRLPVEKDRKGRYLVARLDIERIMREDEAVPLAYDEERIAALERRVSDLEQKLERMESHPITPPRRPPRIPYTTEAPGERLPGGYVPIYDLVKEHGLVRQRQAIIRHMAPWIKQGHWKREGHAVEKALDQEGVREFMRRYGAQE